MERVDHHPDRLEQALELHRQGLRLVPLIGKRAVVRDWPQLRLSTSEVRSWSRQEVNWGILCGEPLVVLDTDTEEADRWVRGHGIDTPTVVRSGGGGRHYYLRSPEGTEIRSKTRLHGIDGLDVRAWHSYIVAAGSTHPETGRPYVYLPGRELVALHRLPVIDPGLLQSIREEPQPAGKSPIRLTTTADTIRDLRAYIRAIPSVEGNYGNKRLMRVCYLLADRCDFETALAELENWNVEVPVPPWGEPELTRALQSAFRSKLRAGVAGGGR